MKLAPLLNGLSYAIGSVLFIIASVFFHPVLSKIELLYKLAVGLFIVGSVLYLLPAVQDWLSCYQRLCNFPKSEMLSVYASMKEESQDVAEVERLASLEIERISVAISRSSVSVLNDILFIVGSVAYWPDFGRPGILVGNWLFRMGLLRCSILGLISTCWALKRTFNREAMHPEMTKLRGLFVTAIIGSIGFLTGGALFLSGIAGPGAIAWAIGSLFFLVSSCIQLSM